MSDGQIGEASQTAPDLIEPVVAYRVLTVYSSGEVHSPYNPEITWVGRHHQAACYRDAFLAARRAVGYEVEPISEHGPVPAHNCKCGIYGYYEPESCIWLAQALSAAIIAVMTVSGRIEAHAKGLRAERVELCAVAKPPRFRGFYTRPGGWAEYAAERLGVPLVPYEQLEWFGAEYGSPLPTSLRPDPSVYDECTASKLQFMAAPAATYWGFTTTPTRRRRYWPWKTS